MGRVTIGSHVFELADEEARVLGEAAMLQSRKGGWISPTDGLLIAVTPSTEITLQIPGEFADLTVAKPASIIDPRQCEPYPPLSFRGFSHGAQTPSP